MHTFMHAFTGTTEARVKMISYKYPVGVHMHMLFN